MSIDNQTAAAHPSDRQGARGIWSAFGDHFRRVGAYFPFALALLSALVLIVALVSQYAGGDKPCVLCISQRYPYVVALILGMVGAVFYDNVLVRVMMLAVITIGFLYGLGVGGYQVGAEWGWWRDDIACGGTVIAPGGLSVQNLTVPVVRCGESAWKLFGVSMAGYNVLLSAGLALITGLSTWFSYSREA